MNEKLRLGIRRAALFLAIRHHIAVKVHIKNLAGRQLQTGQPGLYIIGRPVLPIAGYTPIPSGKGGGRAQHSFPHYRANVAISPERPDETGRIIRLENFHPEHFAPQRIGFYQSQRDKRRVRRRAEVDQCIAVVQP